MPLRAEYTAAAAPAGPEPTISTSYASRWFSSSAARFSAPVSTFATISASVIRPEPNSTPFMNTAGTPITLRSVISFWNTAPSIAVCLMRGFSTAIRFSACTTSGQLWQESE